MGSAQSRWVLKFGPIVPRKLGANGSLLTRRWREADSNHRSREIGGRFEGNTGIYGRMARGAARTQALPTICHGILSPAGTVNCGHWPPCWSSEGPFDASGHWRGVTSHALTVTSCGPRGWCGETKRS